MALETFNNLVNWDNLYKNSETFKKNKPIKYGFVEEFFVRDFYEKLYNTYPQLDETWMINNEPARSAASRFFNNSFYISDEHQKDDQTLSKEWNLVKRYFLSEEFTNNVKKYSRIPIKKIKYFSFILLRKGDFQLPHIDGDKTIQLNMLLYFSKNWQKGDPGGTYISSKEDESTIIFEPCNLDNSVVCFPPSTPKSWHGTRYITKNVKRQAVALAWE
jgi:hypothetical protein